MALFNLLGALLTALALTLLGVGGYLAALLFLWRKEGERRPPDPLSLAIASLLLAMAEAVVVALALGAVGLLRLELALLLQTLLVFVLHRKARRLGDSGSVPFTPLRLILRRSWERLRDYPVLSLITLHAGGTELLRGLVRPPLSWDSLMYHVYLAATWLQEGHLGPFPARHPLTFYEFMPGDGSLWLWWWMAPSHSELYLNVAFAPQWLLLGLAVGALARELGARRHWPIASFLTLLTPAVVRFVATQYVDIAVGAFLVSGSYFAVRWLRTAKASEGALVGIAAGLTAGTKVLALPSAAALGAMVLFLARGRWRVRIPHLLSMALLAAALGGYFYARNIALGGGPFAYVCASQDTSSEGGALGTFPSERSPAAILPELISERMLTGAFLGVTRPTMSELGVGPQSLLLLPIALLLPLLFRERGRRAASTLIWGQILVQLFVWMTLTSASQGHIFANIRYLIAPLGFSFAAAVALGERRLSDAWLRGLAVVLGIQDLLMLNPRMPFQVRAILAWILVGTVVLVAWPKLPRILAARWKVMAAVLAVCLLALVPPWAAYRIEDRSRSFEQDYIAHLSTTRLFAAGWGWLDEHAGTATVAVSQAPENYFVYPAMGPYLERRAIYVNVNEADFTNPLEYPSCAPRAKQIPAAWYRNLRKHEVQWLHVGRYPELDFPIEDAWARSRPDRFRLRFEDRTNRIYELVR